MALEVLHQSLEFAETGGVNLAQGSGEVLKRCDLGFLVAADGGFALQQCDATLGRIQRGKRAREHRLLHAHPLQFLLFSGTVLALLGEGDLEQGPEGSLFLRAGRLPELLGDTFLEVGADLVANVLLEAAHDQPLVAEIFRGVVVGIADGGGVEQTHQRGKAARRAIVRRGRQQHHGVGTAREHAGQSGATRHAILVATRRHVVALINDDDVPPGVLQVIPVLKVVLEGIDRDDGAVVIVERVVIAGNVVAHPLQVRPNPAAPRGWRSGSRTPSGTGSACS